MNREIYDRYNNNYGNLSQYYREVSTPVAWKISNRVGYVPTDIPFITQMDKNIMVDEDGTAGPYDSLGLTGSTNYGYGINNPIDTYSSTLINPMSIISNQQALENLRAAKRFQNFSQNYATFMKEGLPGYNDVWKY